MKIFQISLFTLVCILISFLVKAQDMWDSLPFIQCDQNKIICFSDSAHQNNLFHKFHHLNRSTEDKIQILHIGDSHLQAGFFTEKIKQTFFQQYNANNTDASPGFVFPYTIAQTNNPFYYNIQYSGKWDWCRNVDAEKTCSLGLSGITVRTNNLESSFSIKMQNKKYPYPVKYHFNTVKIFHNTDSSFRITCNNQPVKPENGYSILQLENLTDSVLISISKKDTNSYFELYGIILENNETSINYHTIGVNGSTAQSYLKCDYFSKQLKTINPDLIIVSLGTNEAYDKDFSKLKHEFELKDLIFQIKDAAPEALIILTSPNDHLTERKHNNPNTKLVQENILKISEELELCFWDFYTIMGGKNSIQQWHDKGLTGNDKLHFKKAGYEIQGELFSKALIEFLKHEGIE